MIFTCMFSQPQTQKIISTSTHISIKTSFKKCLLIPYNDLLRTLTFLNNIVEKKEQKI